MITVDKEKLMTLIYLYEDLKDTLQSFPTALGDYFDYDVYEDIDIVDEFIEELRKRK